MYNEYNYVIDVAQKGDCLKNGKIQCLREMVPFLRSYHILLGVRYIMRGTFREVMAEAVGKPDNGDRFQLKFVISALFAL